MPPIYLGIYFYTSNFGISILFKTHTSNFYDCTYYMKSFFGDEYRKPGPEEWFFLFIYVYTGMSKSQATVNEIIYNRKDKY